ncbi:MAG TPA: arginine biosynthesis bifunctional protein ArgJ, partial [Cyanobacteria bacterium UBA8156]|nr:arginine biosynthesis bifunctional protein ArgJ [Cyanobacteria bacterium UBA8156]
MKWQQVAGSVTAPQGFRAAGIAAGLKPSGSPDLTAIVSEVGAIAAGVLTTSVVRAACVDLNREILESGQRVRAILCNAGQANACTGEEGWQNAQETIRLAQQALGTAEGVLIASTGRIGQQLDMPKLRAGIPQVLQAAHVQGGDEAARSILTTDLVPKAIALEAEIAGKPVRLGGIAKGSGMIHPNMATMLAFVTCDAAVGPMLWQDMTRRAADRSFNQITVDGDTSTNDMLLGLSNGQSGTPAITQADSAEARLLEEMLTEVCIYLAKAIARDGEGATCLLEVRVTGAESDRAARQMARTAAGSSLVKSALFGRDPNWGRLAAAVGRAGVPFDPQALQIQLGNFRLMEKGCPLTFDWAAAGQYLRDQAAASGTPEAQKLDAPVTVEIAVGAGPGTGQAWGCDLSYDYVK